MSTEIEVTNRKKITLQDTARRIVKLLYDQGPKTYDEIAKELEIAESTVRKWVDRLEELGIVKKFSQKGRVYVTLVDTVEVDEEGNVYIETAEETDEERLYKLLTELNVPTSERRRRQLVEMWKMLPPHERTPENLFQLLTAFGVRRDAARWIVRSIFGTDPLGYYHPYPFGPVSGPYMPYAPFRPPFGAQSGAVAGPYFMYPGAGAHDREIIRLELALESLKEELKRLREEQSRPQQSTVPMIRRIKTDEHGRPIEIIEEPATLGVATRSDETLVKLIMELQKQRYEDREQFMKMFYEQQKTYTDAINRIADTLKDIINRVNESLREQDERRREEIEKLREEMHKKDLEYMRQIYEREIEELKTTIDSVRRYYEDQTKRMLEDLKKEIEWARRLEELQRRASTFEKLRDETIDTLRTLREDLRSTLREYLQQQIKLQQLQLLRPQIPVVSQEEKREFVKKLKKKAKRGETKAEAKSTDAESTPTETVTSEFNVTEAPVEGESHE